MKVKKVSKRHKSTWRKHIDVSDVDAYLEEERFIERCGKAFEEKSDAELFRIDKKPKSLIKESVLCPRPKSIDDLNLKCFQGLQVTSNVQDPIAKRNTVRTKEQRQHPILKKKNELCLRKGILKRKDIHQLQKFLHKRISCFEEKSRRRVAIDKDLWEDEETDGSKLSKLKPWFDDRTFLHTVKNTGDLKSKSKYRPQSAKTIVSSFETPHPGTSYNPTFKDHINLANSIAEKELAIQKEDAHLSRVTQNAFKQITVAQNEKNWLTEMSEGNPLLTNGVEEFSTHDDDGTEYKAINPPVCREKKKTKKQRKKASHLRKEELQRNEIKEQKKKSADICRVEDIMHEIVLEEIQTKKRSLKRLQKSASKFECARRTGRNKYVPLEAPISEITELTGSLREVIPQGNVLKDKLVNMQKRNLIEITKPQFKTKKKKGKKYKLSSHDPACQDSLLKLKP